MNNKYDIRTKCIFCDSNLDKTIFEYDLENYVAHYSVDVDEKEFISIPYNVCICKVCKTPQTKYLGKLEDIYRINHADSTGTTMINLHKESLKMILKYKDRVTNIVEIGSSVGVLADMILDNFDLTYNIIEPSYFGSIDNKKVIYGEDMGNYIITKDDINEYISTYSPTKFIIEDELSENFIDTKLIKREIERTSAPIMKYNIYRYFYSMNKCVELALENSNYDMFIITRSDMLIHRFPDITDEHIMIPTIYNHDRTPPPGTHQLEAYYIDSVLIGIPLKYINTYVGIINKLDEYYDKGYHYSFDHILFANLYETGLLNNTKQYNIDNFYFEIKRNQEGTIKHRLW